VIGKQHQETTIRRKPKQEENQNKKKPKQEKTS